jgi:pimeloyl-ACP methyl ester carboxylesterase
MRLAGIKNSPIKKLILNDIGPEVPEEDLKIIADYLKGSYEFDDLTAFKEQLKTSRGPNYGPMSEADWDYMAQTIHRVLPEGKITYAFDPLIRLMFEQQPVGELDIWWFWDQIVCPVLIIRGAKSTIFPQYVASDMMNRGPCLEGLCTFELWEECGHVPSLMNPQQIDIINNWLRGAPGPK